jgi:F-type H+-transporting ATPase subunit b
VLIASLVILAIIIFFIIFPAMLIMFRKIITKNVVLATQHIDELSQDMSKKEQQLNKQLEESKQKSQEIINKAQEEAEKLKNQIIKDTEAERDKILTQARSKSEEIIQQADKSRQQLLAEINERIEKEAINKACELIQYTLPDVFKQDVHAHWVKELIEGGFAHLERLRIPTDIKEAKVVSAFSLQPEQRKALDKKLTEALGRDISLKEEIDSKLVAGLVIFIGSLVLDGSLKNKIQERAKSA